MINIHLLYRVIRSAIVLESHYCFSTFRHAKCRSRGRAIVAYELRLLQSTVNLLLERLYFYLIIIDIVSCRVVEIRAETVSTIICSDMSTLTRGVFSLGGTVGDSGRFPCIPD
jgi:hypothetical protein